MTVLTALKSIPPSHSDSPLVSERDVGGPVDEVPLVFDFGPWPRERARVSGMSFYGPTYNLAGNNSKQITM